MSRFQAKNLRTSVSLLFVALLSAFEAPLLYAGATASHVVVVVNAASENSRTVANHYAKIRNIPSRNMIFLEKVPASEKISSEVFREQILKPLLEEIDRRDLERHIQCIAYSADFPTAIDISVDVAGIKDLPFYLTPVASINGLTYLYRIALSQPGGVVALDTNFYCRRRGTEFFRNPLSGARKADWDALTKLVEEGQHSAAAEQFEKLFKEFPLQFPYAYSAAKEYAKADKASKAIEMLNSAIGAGWSFGGDTAADPDFAKIRDDKDFQLAMLALDDSKLQYMPTQAFDARSFWAPNGIPNRQQADGVSYFTSIVLATTRKDGNTIDEAVAGFQRSQGADFSLPSGRFYFTSTSDVRTKTRFASFPIAMESLKSLGYESEIIKDTLPANRLDCLGVCAGTPNFAWKSSRSRMLPGAIAENLTSLGGVMTSAGGQTKLTAFIREGAAGSSGTVTEPYTIQEKFPHPMLYSHYAEGATLAEAFYQAVRSPYQLLIVGDPLCQPFCRPPRLDVEGIKPYDKVDKQLKFTLDRSGGDEDSNSVGIQIFIDGLLARESLLPERVQLGVDEMAPGWHELRLVSVDDSRLARQIEYTFPIRVDKGPSVTLNGPPSVSLVRQPTFKLHANAPGADSIELRHHWEMIVNMPGDKAEFEINSTQLGLGPVRLMAVAKFGEQVIASQPIVVEVKN